MPETLVFPIHGTAAPSRRWSSRCRSRCGRLTARRLEDGERVVVLRRGPDRPVDLLVARERGAPVLIVDPLEDRLAVGRASAPRRCPWTTADEIVALAACGRGRGPQVVFDATGVPDAVQAAVELAAPAGRVVQVGMSGDERAAEARPLHEKELDVLGVAAAGRASSREAVALAERNARRLAQLVSHEFPLADAPEAIQFAMEHPREVMKVVIRGD